MTTSALKADVVVVGAGPAGLATAIAATSGGLSVLVVDQQPAGANTSRAAVVHARTLEVLADVGAAEPLLAQGVRVPQFTVRERDTALVAVRFDDLPTPYPYTLMISQAQTEAALLARATQIGVQVLRPAAVVDVDAREDEVTATLDDGRVVRAGQLVGADGMHSVVRDRIRVPFEGGAYAESFSLADVRLHGGVPRDEVQLYFSPDGLVVVAPLPDGLHRVVATVAQAPATPDVPFVQHLLDVRGPRRRPATVDAVVWGSRFRVHHRVAGRFRVGHVALVGDAAHVHSPAGGQGMNLGIQDGVDLGHSLAQALIGRSPDRLDTYDARRRPIAQEVVTFTDRLTRLATAGPRLRVVRNAALATMSHLPPVQRRLAWQLSGLTHRQ